MALGQRRHHCHTGDHDCRKARSVLFIGSVHAHPHRPSRLRAGRTGLIPYLALWKDLGRRVGLHTYIGGEIPLAGYGRDAPDAVMQYALAPTITVTPCQTPHLGDLTFFLEANGTTAVRR